MSNNIFSEGFAQSETLAMSRHAQSEALAKVE